MSRSKKKLPQLLSIRYIENVLQHSMKENEIRAITRVFSGISS